MERSAPASARPDARPASAGGTDPSELRGLGEAAAFVAALLTEIGRVTDRLIAPLRGDDYARIHHAAMGPIAWDVAHVAQQEDLWIAQTLGGLAEARPALNRTYDAYENPRPTRTQLPLLGKAAARRLRDDVRRRTLRVLRDAPRDPDDERWKELFVAKMVVLHEAQHGETILQHAAAVPGARYVPSLREPPPPARAAWKAESFVRHPGGDTSIGQPRHTPWTYDNEWPAHHQRGAPFWLQRTPVTNRLFLRFMAAGGYTDPAWWRPEGWQVAQEEGWEAPLHWTRREGGWHRRAFDRTARIDPDEPVVHVSWYEADACARFLGARLPTETEWETAATIDPATGAKRRWPWGEAEPDAARANLDQVRWSPDPVGSHPEGGSPLGVEQLIGDVWEWTATRFGPYPGFRAFPYRDYSERFFPDGLRVLRGGSWATRDLLRLGTFRNWDLPRRRQIFAGFRLAADAPPPWAHPEEPAA